MNDTSRHIRQWSLLRRLLRAPDGATIAELCAEFDVADKTIRRDIAALVRSGFPLKENVGESGKKTWRVPSADSVPALTFRHDEAFALYMGRRLLDPLAGTYFWESAQDAIRKVRECLPPQALKYLDKMSSAFHQTQSGRSDYADKAEMIDDLLVAIEDRKITQLTYQSERSTEPTTRDAYPLGFTFHQGSLYLLAHSADADEIRTYKLDRISRADFDPRPNLPFREEFTINLADYLSTSFGIYSGDGKDDTTIRIRFLPPVVQYVSEKKWHPTQKLSPQKDGSLIAQFRLSATSEVKHWIAGFSPNALVLEPEALKQEMIDDATRLLEAYGKQQVSTIKDDDGSMLRRKGAGNSGSHSGIKRKGTRS